MSRRPTGRIWLAAALLLSLGANAVLGGVLLGRGRAAGGERPQGRVERREARDGRAADGGWRDSRLGRKLGLEPAQVEALEAGGAELNRALQPLRERMRETRREVLGLLRAEEPDPVLLAEAGRRLAELQVAVEKLYTQNFLRLKAVLTPEQENQFFLLMEERFSSKGR